MNILKGQLKLCYNYELDEFFIVKRGPIFGKFLLEDKFGTTIHKSFEDLKKSTTLLNNSIIIEHNF